MNLIEMCVKVLTFLFFFCGWSDLFVTSTCLVQFKQSDPIVINKYEFDVINEITPQKWKDFAERGVESNNQEKRLEANLVASNIVIQNDTISHVQLLDNLPSFESQKNSEVADEILKSSLFIYNSKCAPMHISGKHCELILSDVGLPEGSILSQKCQDILNGRQDRHNPLRRLLPRHYKDGFYKVFINDFISFNFKIKILASMLSRN